MLPITKAMYRSIIYSYAIDMKMEEERKEKMRIGNRAVGIWEKDVGRHIIIVKSELMKQFVAEHNYAVMKAVSTGNESYLYPFEDVSVEDSEGKHHLLETSLTNIRKMIETFPYFRVDNLIKV